MTYWFRVMLWTVLGIIASCFALIGIAMCAINVFLIAILLRMLELRQLLLMNQ